MPDQNNCFSKQKTGAKFYSSDVEVIKFLSFNCVFFLTSDQVNMLTREIYMALDKMEQTIH